MNKTKQLYQFTVTTDSSLTVSHGESEDMHSRHGALEETEYIYGQGILISLKGQLAPHFCVVGLGLGYIEMVLVAHCLGNSIDLPLIHIDSFESDPQLIQNLLSWLHEKSTTQGEFKKAYDLALTMIADRFQVEPNDLRQTLLALYSKNQWRLRGRLSENTSFDRKYNTILFDAYSSQSSPELWTMDLLLNFLDQAANSSCLFTTYAATGILKRSLRKSGFELIKKAGYAVKRESTLAIRNVSLPS